MVTASDTQLKTAFQECPPSLVRNVCIIAHVDHGKTTLADFMVSSNGIISARLAGKLRYMDNREDEQNRGITMKSSAISLFYEPLLLNLIDSPGHVDFVTEVSSAIDLADIAILIVDVVEGVCPQTDYFIRQAIARKLDILLVLNKLDRLVLELKMHESEAHRHLQQLIEHINSCLSQAIRGQLFEEDWQTVEQMEKELHFDPARGNVLFASGLHGYAFSLQNFASIWAKRISMANSGPENEAELAKQLNEHFFSRDHFFSASSKKICSGGEQRGKKSLFEQFILGPLWEVHRCALVDKDLEKLQRLSAKLNIAQLKGKRVEEAFVEMMRNWLPLSSAIVCACARMRSAQKAFQSDDRIRQLLPPPSEESEAGCSAIPSSPAIESLRNCDPDDALTLVFIAKAFKLSGRRVSLCRVMSGTLSKSDNFFVLSSAKSPSVNDRWNKVQIGSPYLLLGRELLPVDRVPAGRICAIESAEEERWITGQLLCSQPLSIADAELPRIGLHQKFSEPLVRVTVRPSNAGMAELEELKAALGQLSMIDSAVRILEQDDGDLAMVTAGEVHLQKCLEDLNALGQTDLVVSEPIVPFLETLIPVDVTTPYSTILNQKTECFLRQFSLQITLRAVPLPEPLVQLLNQNHKLIEAFGEGASDDLRTRLDAFRSQLSDCAKTCLPPMKGSWWAKKSADQISALFSRIWAFGPARAKPNILFDGTFIGEQNGGEQGNNDNIASIWEGNLSSRHQAIVAGFQMAMFHGPLCGEPLQGVGIILEGWRTVAKVATKDKEENEEETKDSSLDDGGGGDQGQPADADHDQGVQTVHLHGQLISAIRQTCHAALKKHTGGLRLVAPMYLCTVQSPAQALGKVQAVLARKRAKVISEEVNELTGLFEISAHLPVIESFSFCDELRKRTSGTASARLEFSHWQCIEEDPYWKPTTEEEIEEFGAHGQEKNQARFYMDTVRRRKGLPVEELIVINAEKQRNLTRNK